MFKYIFIIVLLLLISTFILADNYNENSVTVATYITGVDIENDRIILDDKAYTLQEDCIIKRNDISSSLFALKEIMPDFYHWAELELDQSGLVIRIEAYYQVFEGVIKDISYTDCYLEVDTYNERKDTNNKFKLFYWQDEHIEQIDELEKNQYIVLITANEKILKIIN